MAGAAGRKAEQRRDDGWSSRSEAEQRRKLARVAGQKQSREDGWSSRSEAEAVVGL